MSARPEAKCPCCGKVFSTNQGLGQHQRHARRTAAKGHANRICPDRRDDAEARDTAMRIIRLKSKLGLLGRHS